MLSHPGKDRTNFLTFRFDLDGVAHPALQGEFVSLSHRLSLARHYHDRTRRGNVTDGRTRMAGCAIRGPPDPSAGSASPDAQPPATSVAFRQVSLVTRLPEHSERM